MDTVTLLRELWRHRIAVVIAWVLAMLAGTFVLFNVSFPPHLTSRKYDIGVASTSILIDTPSSQVVEIAPANSPDPMLGTRADLLSRLMVDGVVKDSIAQTAGIPTDKLYGISKMAAAQSNVQPASAPPTHGEPVMTTQVALDNNGNELPIIQVDTQAGNAADAAKLADAAVAGLRKFLDSKAAAQQIPNATRLRVDALGVTQAVTVTRGPKNIYAVAAVLFVFGLGCAIILIVAAVKRGWRAAITAEQQPATGPDRTPGSPAPAGMDNGHAGTERTAPAGSDTGHAGVPRTAQAGTDPIPAAATRPAPVVPTPQNATGSWMTAPTRAAARSGQDTTPASASSAPPSTTTSASKDHHPTSAPRGGRSLLRRRRTSPARSDV